MRDLQTGTTELVSQRASDGPQGGTSTAPAINRDGRYVAFKSTSTNLVANDGNGGADVFLRDRTNGSVTRVSVATSGAEAKAGSGSPAISADGKVVAFDSPADNLVGADLNGSTDVFVRDLDRPHHLARQRRQPQRRGRGIESHAGAQRRRPVRRVPDHGRAARHRRQRRLRHLHA